MYVQKGRGAPDLSDLADWLKSQPLPVGILAPQDRTALVVIRAAIRCGLQVPEQVAVLSINNEELITDLSWPTISSIDHGAERIGRDAAELLDRRIRSGAHCFGCTAGHGSSCTGALDGLSGFGRRFAMADGRSLRIGRRLTRWR